MQWDMSCSLEAANALKVIVSAQAKECTMHNNEHGRTVFKGISVRLAGNPLADCNNLHLSNVR